ncbi:MAG: group III truncated hemoglobin, partial [Novosphingobium sp.]
MNEPGLGELVDAFYARVRSDAQLGPVFNGAIADWPDHLDKLAAFWSSVMLASGSYKGQPVPAHRKHRVSITPEMFERWLGLWRDVTS